MCLSSATTLQGDMTINHINSEKRAFAARHIPEQQQNAEPRVAHGQM
jgi:hypothetical protein